MVGAALFLLLAACLEQQGLGRVPLYALDAWLCCTALAVVATPDRSFGNRPALALAARSLLLALPLALVLFAFFPRLSGSFWALPKGGAAVTGLSDTMDPGSISELTESDEPALRVRFDGRRHRRRSATGAGPCCTSSTAISGARAWPDSICRTRWSRSGRHTAIG